MKVLTDIHTDFSAVANSRDVMVADNERWKALRQQAQQQFSRAGLPGRKKKTGNTPVCGRLDSNSSNIRFPNRVRPILPICNWLLMPIV